MQAWLWALQQYSCNFSSPWFGIFIVNATERSQPAREKRAGIAATGPQRKAREPASPSMASTREWACSMHDANGPFEIYDMTFKRALPTATLASFAYYYLLDTWNVAPGVGTGLLEARPVHVQAGLLLPFPLFLAFLLRSLPTIYPLFR